MSRVALTKHAAKRMQQRCIPPLVIEWLLDYGHRQPSFDAVRVSFDRQAKKEISRSVGPQVVSLLAKYFNSAIVVAPDTDEIITVEWLH